MAAMFYEYASLSDSLPLRLAGVPHVAHYSCSDAAEETEKCCQGVWSNMTDWVFLKSRILHYDGRWVLGGTPSITVLFFFRCLMVTNSLEMH